MHRFSRRASLSPEQYAAQRRKIRYRFRAIVRLANANRYWLQDLGEEELGENVKKNILVLLSKKKGKKSLFTLEEKALLRKNASDRTKAEVDKIFRIIGNFKCFRRYPKNVKYDLAAVSYFMYYRPGRTIVRQDHEAYAIYFILLGTVRVQQETFDEILQQTVLSDLGTMEAGQLFGEVSLLHGIPRTATITTETHCELLCLYRKDFQQVLQRTLQDQWNVILSAMSRFSYFDNWDDVTQRECCIMSKIVDYKAGDVIYGSSKSSAQNVHFILSGQCRMVECLSVEVINRGGKKTYKRFDLKKYNKILEGDLNLSPGNTHVDKSVSWVIHPKELIPVKISSVSIRKKRSVCISNASVRIAPSIISAKSSNLIMSSKKSIISQDSNISVSICNLNRKRSQQELVDEEENNKDLAIEIKDVLQFKQSSVAAAKDYVKPKNVENIFMQVCLLNELAFFGLGEFLKNRQIVAVTDVKILQVPKYWILQKNKGNLWDRIVHYFNNHIPTSEDVFKVFTRDRQWIYYKQDLVKSLVKRPPVNNHNNIPLSIRIQHHPDMYYKE